MSKLPPLLRSSFCYHTFPRMRCSPHGCVLSHWSHFSLHCSHRRKDEKCLLGDSSMDGEKAEETEIIKSLRSLCSFQASQYFAFTSYATIHRVGRTACAGKGGEAWSIIVPANPKKWVEGNIRGDVGDHPDGEKHQERVDEGLWWKGSEYETRATEVQLSFERATDANIARAGRCECRREHFGVCEGLFCWYKAVTAPTSCAANAGWARGVRLEWAVAIDLKLVRAVLGLAEGTGAKGGTGREVDGGHPEIGWIGRALGMRLA
ncbi:hypothetical protein EDB19DRAFT_2028686 [Suillus lakei]|nr:hypothetical protein EDB19DRAFT_2028686 [Suillus lakei]